MLQQYAGLQMTYRVVALWWPAPRTALLGQLYVLPHRDRDGRSNFLPPHPPPPCHILLTSGQLVSSSVDPVTVY